jgi:signal transduction histidine kinase
LDSPNILQRIEGDRVTTFYPPQPARFLRAMTVDASGDLWIGTAEGQLLKVEGDKLVAETNTLQRPHSIRGLASTTDGAVWIGYAGIGLGRVKNGQLHRISNAGGLLDSYISQIVADAHGRLWLGSNRGIFHVRLSELEEFFEGKRERVRSIAYGKGEGLPSLQASFDFYPGAFRSRGGSLWMPTRTGLAVIRPDQIRDDPRPPSVWIENLAVDAKVAPPDEANPFALRPLPWNGFLAMPPASALKIPPRHHKLDFDFTALSFTAPDNVHFRYRLEGVDPDWVESGGVRHASYSLLPAGNYKFHVTACNHRGVWNPEGATLAFTVLPFFWQTWWFRGAMLMAFSILLVAVARVIFLRRVRAQMRELEQQAALHKERARIAKDIHDDLGANLTEIALLTELAQQDTSAPGKSGEYFDRIAGTARHVIKSLDEIVWAVNPRNDTLADFIDYTAQFALDHLRLADIRCRLDLPEVAPARELSADVRHNLFLATKEALHNVVKHSKATETWVRIAVSDEGVRIVVEDNGRGFEFSPETATADGLRNMENRLRDIGGALKVQSQLNCGSKVTIELPWPKK